MNEAKANAVEWTVSELSAAVKRSIEDAYGFVRVRGEISGFRGAHASGHCYFSLKDESAKIEAVIWKGAFARMRIKPEEGLEVIVSGRLTTYPGQSKYQIVVETLEPAGLGALMALLEERKKKLAAEGLFDAARKQLLPFLPAVIGVVTSPTGAVIRDILHRLADRFPRHVLVWPVRVQGEGSAEQVAGAIRGFNALPAGGAIARPDLIIVARGGGSLEDLWSFNEEIVVRAAAESMIPLIAAVGHETDVTLIDFAADKRAPTPSAAAEMAVPVRARPDRRGRPTGGPGARRLVARPGGAAHRAARRDARAAGRAGAAGGAAAAARSCGGAAAARAHRQCAAASHPVLAHRRAVRPAAVAHPHQAMRRAHRRARRAGAARRSRWRGSAGASGWRPPRCGWRRASRPMRRRMGPASPGRASAPTALGERARRAVRTLLHRQAAVVERDGQLLAALSHRGVLARGFALVRDSAGKPLRLAAAVSPGMPLDIEFADGRVRARAEGASAAGAGPAAPDGSGQAAQPPGARQRPGQPVRLAHVSVGGRSLSARAAVTASAIPAPA